MADWGCKPPVRFQVDFGESGRFWSGKGATPDGLQFADKLANSGDGAWCIERLYRRIVPVFHERQAITIAGARMCQYIWIIHRALPQPGR